MHPALTPRALNCRMAGAGLMRRPARGGGGVNRPIPQQIPGLFAWWRADSGITVGTGVSAWTSRVNGHVLAQATGAKQPEVTTAAELGSKPVVRFDGSNDVLVSTAAASVWNFLHDGTGMTVLLACVPRAGGFNLTLWSSGSNGGGAGVWYRIDASANAIYAFLSDAATNYIIAATPSHASIDFDTALITDMSYVESASPEYVVRSADATRSSGTTSGPPETGPGVGPLALGAFSDNGAEGANDIAEVIVYNRAVSAAEKAAVYAYLAARYV